MKVSVVMAVYNRASLIGECLKSILAQTFQDFEVIVVDDFSDDETLEILRAFARRDTRIRVFANPRHKFIETLNMGMSMAQGEYIARIDSDDVMLPDRLSKQVEVLDQDNSLAVCCSLYDGFGVTPSQYGHLTGRVNRPYYCLLLGNFIANPTSMIRKSFLDNYGLCYQEENIYSEDYKLWADIARFGGGFYIIPERLTKCRHHDNQLSIVHHEIQSDNAFKVQLDILNDLVGELSLSNDRYEKLFNLLAAFNDEELLSADTIFLICYELSENRYRHYSIHYT